VARSSTRRAARVFVLSTCTVAVAALFAGIVRQSWVTNSATAGVVRLESHGAEIMHPMTTLVGELVEAQSAAVRGEKVDAAAIRKALSGVAGIDQEYGVQLQTPKRLTELRSAVESALTKAESGREAYETYTGLVTLALDLVRQISDTSHLIHDADLDSYYLMDAAVVRLPNAIVLAGRASDLVTLAGGKILQGEDAVRAAVARFGVSAVAEEVREGLGKSLVFTASSDLGANIAARLDAFQAAAAVFAPPTMLTELAGTVDPATLASNARRVYAAALPLSHGLLHELEDLLDARQAKLAGEWRFTTVAAGLGTAFGLVMVWLLALTRRRVSRGDEPTDMSGNTGRPDDVRLGSLSYARELLEAEELVHVGRAVRTRPRERGDAR
jgi:hypothetical protein